MHAHRAARTDLIDVRRQPGHHIRWALLCALAATLLLVAGVLAPSAGALSAHDMFEQASLAAPSPVAGDVFGSSVAIDGDTAIVGAPGFPTSAGVAYVFVRVDGAWALQQTLTAADGAADDRFGFSVALDGDTAAVGAYKHDSVEHDSGAAYVFVRSGATWTQQAKLTPADYGIGGDRFGWVVSVDGDTVAVGAPMRDVTGSPNAGAAYVFTRSGASWSQQAKIALPNPTPLTEDRFGAALDLDGEALIVGSDYRKTGNIHTGAAFVYVRSGGTWSQQAELLAPQAQNGESFGAAVALDGDRALVGAPNHDYSYKIAMGIVYAYQRSGGTWSGDGWLAATDGAGGDEFGSSLALEGAAALIGAPDHNTPGKSGSGSTYAFWHGVRGWAECAELTSDSLTANEHLPGSLAVSGATALVGSPSHPVAGTANGGTAFLYTLEAPPVTTAVLDPALSATGWTLGPVTVTLNATDAGSGVVGTNYRFIGSPNWSTYSGPFQVPGSGLWTYEYYSIDAAGFYEGVHKVDVGIGNSERPPVTEAALSPTPDASGWNTSPVTVTLAATSHLDRYETKGGILRTEYRVEGAADWTTYAAPFKVDVPGIWTYEYRSIDLAGVTEQTKSLTVRLKTKPAFSLTSRSNSALGHGAAFKITGTLKIAAAATPLPCVQVILQAAAPGKAFKDSSRKATTTIWASSPSASTRPPRRATACASRAWTPMRPPPPRV